MVGIKIKKIVCDILFEEPDQITLLRKSMRRVRKQYDNLLNGFDYNKHCCLTCASGGYDLRLTKKLSRQAMMLRVMLRKRGEKKDLKEIKDLEFEYGKSILDNLEKTGGK